MKTVNFTLTFLAAIALVFLSGGLLGAAETGTAHASKGTLLSVDAKTGRVVMTEASGSHTLFLNQQTEILDETGHITLAAFLRTGDLVREECLLEEQDKGVARQIRVLRPAWMDSASPEM